MEGAIAARLHALTPPTQAIHPQLAGPPCLHARGGLAFLAAISER
jgi:hypothetical protein